MHRVNEKAHLYSASVRPLTFDEACDLRMLLFGKIDDSFPYSWLGQGLRFEPRKPFYRLIQMSGGPCGVISSIQAFVMYDMFFNRDRKAEQGKELDFSRFDVKRESLARAMVSILMQVSQFGRTLMVFKGNATVFSNRILKDCFKRDNNIEYLNVRAFANKEELQNFLITNQCVSHYMNDTNGGVVTFLYSVLLTKGIDNIRKEMDEESSLIGDSDGYCSQELVNLLLTGKAVTNVFNGDMTLEGDSDTTSKDESKDTKPNDGRGDATPIDGNRNASPIDGREDATPIDGIRDVTPLNGSKDATQMNGNKDATQMNGNKDATQMNGSEEATQMNGNKDEKPKGENDVTVCKGIPRRNKIGLLSMFEYHGTLSIGSFYKNPMYPIWVVNTFNHYSVLYGKSCDVLKEDFKEPFTLTQVDNMSRKSCETIVEVNPMVVATVSDSDMDCDIRDEPYPIEKCVLCRWPKATVKAYEG